jgi:hypothetical protein
MVAALAALRMSGLDWGALALVSLLLVAWASPLFKLADPAQLLLGFFAAQQLLLHPDLPHAVIAGAVVGIAGVFGLNYGLYLAIGISCVAIAVAIRALDADAIVLLLGGGLAGAALGSAPLWILMLRSPAFASALYERRVRTVLQRGTTNLPLPIPWPWRPAPLRWRARNRTARLFGGWMFVAMPTLGFGALLGLVLLPWPYVVAHAPFFAAGTLLAAAQHHPFSRADMHLLSAMPLVSLCALTLAGGSWSDAILPAAVLGAGAVALSARGLKRKLRRALGTSATDADALSKRRADFLEVVRRLHAQHLRPGDTILALPALVYLYPLLGLRSPVYDTYCVYPAPEEDQSRMLTEIEESGVRLAVIEEHALDGREDLRFSCTHPRVWAHLQQTFTKLPLLESLPGYHFFLRGDAASDAPRAARTVGSGAA